MMIFSAQYLLVRDRLCAEKLFVAGTLVQMHQTAALLLLHVRALCFH